MPPPPPNLQPTSNPLAGYETLGAEIDQLRTAMAAGTVSAKELAQEQANLIDNHVALAQIRAKEMHDASALTAKIAALNTKINAAGKATMAEGAALAQLNSDLIETQARITNAATASKVLRGALSAVVAEQEKLTNALEAGLKKHLVGVATEATSTLAKAGGDFTNFALLLGKGVATLAPGVAGALGSAVGVVAAPVGALLAFVSAAAMLVRSATRETSTYVNTFGSQFGMASEAQRVFRQSIGFLNKTMYSVADLQTTASAAMQSGAFSAYTANVGLANVSDDASVRLNELNRRMAPMVVSMAQWGKAMGMDYKQSGVALGTMVNNMGAIDPTAEDLNAQLAKTQYRFAQLQTATNMSMPRILSLMSGLGEATLPMGVSFNAVSTRAGMAIKAVGEYGDAVYKSSKGLNLFLHTAENIEKMSRALINYGAALTPMQTFGYELAAGLGNAKDPMEGIIEASGKDPFQRLGIQLDAFKKLGIGVNATVLAMNQSGLPPQYMKIMQGMLSDDKARSALEAAFSAKGKGELDRVISTSGLQGDQQAALAAIANTMQLSRSPLEQLVTLTTNLLDSTADFFTWVTRKWSDRDPVSAGTLKAAELQGGGGGRYTSPPPIGHPS